MTSISFAAETLLKRTISRCVVCGAACPAEVWKVSEGKQAKIFLKRVCPAHGSVSVCISSDARFYWLAQGDPQNACCGGKACSVGEGGTDGTLGRNAGAAIPGSAGVPRAGEDVPSSRASCDGSELDNTGDDCAPLGSSWSRDAATSTRDGCAPRISPFETLSTCLALIEIVHSCNLACPTCYADSPTGAIDAVPLEDLQRRIQGVINRKGRIEILQLSGGEPTLHPQFFELVRWVQEHPAIDYLLLNTNGVRIAKDEAFVRELGATFRYGGMQLYLQFDGVQSEGQQFLRGGDLRAMRRRAIEHCAEMNLPVTLAMTVTLENLPHLWSAIEFGLEFKHIRGIAFQPMFSSGRKPAVTGQKINTADVILAAVEQSRGQLRYEDFTPLPCGDPNCATIGYLLKTEAGVRSISDYIDFASVQGFLRDKVRYSLGDLAKCGCESEPLGDLLKAFELDETSTFRLFIKPFMDAETWDEDRIDRCCTHVIRPDGKLDSFCRYYANGGAAGHAFLSS